jgi:tRNA (uracil-5-)-methyltransferase TRM9
MNFIDMDQASIHRLNNINKQFYDTTATDFDMLRRGAWPGWKRLLPYLTSPLSVLDVGCGNGRFALFLSTHVSPLIYFGIDNNKPLLDRAHETLQHLNARLEQHDIVENPSITLPDIGQFDLVTLFGVLHHVPGSENRLALMQRLAELIKPNGLLAFACWRFAEYERYTSRFTEWPDDISREPHDYLFDWRRGTPALRYCHYVDDAEHDRLVAVTGFTELERYRADGETGDVNCYSILRRE